MKIGFLGLGAMGSRMAAQLVSAGHAVTAWNRTTKAGTGLTLAPSPRDAAAGADVVFSMVRDMPASAAVWLDAGSGALGGMKPGATAVECSTLTPAWMKGLQTHCDGHGVHFVEAPVVGTLPQAETASLRILVGGPLPEAVRPVLSALGTPVEVGPVGQATALKLAVNSLFATQVAVLGEVLALMKTEDIQAERALSMLQGTPVFPPVLDGVVALLKAGDDEARFPVELVEKDLAYATSLGSLPVLSAVRERYANAVEAGFGGLNLHAVTKLS